MTIVTTLQIIDDWVKPHWPMIEMTYICDTNPSIEVVIFRKVLENDNTIQKRYILKKKSYRHVL